MKRSIIVVGAAGLSLIALQLNAAAPAPAQTQTPPPAETQQATITEQETVTIVAVPADGGPAAACPTAKGDCAKKSGCEKKPDCEKKPKCAKDAKCSQKTPCPDYSDNDYMLAYELLELTGTPECLDEANAFAINAQMQQTPMLRPAHAAFRDFFAKHCSYHAMKRKLARMHLETFTRDELRKLIDFFKTPAGRKYAANQNKLMRKSFELRERQIHDNMDELHAHVEKALNNAKQDNPAQPSAGAQK